MNNYFLNITAINIHIDSHLAVCITIMTFTIEIPYTENLVTHHACALNVALNVFNADKLINGLMLTHHVTIK